VYEPAPGAMIKFFVGGRPRSMKIAGTARFQRGGKVHMVPKRGNTEWATLVGAIGQQHAPSALLEGAVLFTATFYMPRPGAGKKAAWPLKRPDLDNLIHKLTDQFNGVFWRDDSQVVELHVCKRFSDDGRLGVEIEVAPL
jgi:Holliday junction resolvase RusA-like endonuclease